MVEERGVKKMDCIYFIWPKVGLFLNFIGTILIAISMRENPEGAYQTGKMRHKIYLAAFYPIWFRFGLILLALGFLFNFFIF
ncbi:MAG: hypothetical protein ABSB32_17635 [Thermodesulfobacteriota bacterium]